MQELEKKMAARKEKRLRVEHAALVEKVRSAGVIGSAGKRSQGECRGVHYHVMEGGREGGRICGPCIGLQLGLQLSILPVFRCLSRSFNLVFPLTTIVAFLWLTLWGCLVMSGLTYDAARRTSRAGAGAARRPRQACRGGQGRY